MSNSRSPEHVWAPESANVSADAGLGAKLAENVKGNGNSLGSMSTSIWIVNLGDGSGACFSNLLPVHSMWGTDEVCCASTETETLTKMYDTFEFDELSEDAICCCASAATSNSLSATALVLFGTFLHTRST